MLGFTLFLGWVIVQITLTDLLDLRYNKEYTLKLIPGIDISWVGVGESTIVSLILSWLNLELSFIIFDYNYYSDEIDSIIDEIDKKNNSEDESTD